MHIESQNASMMMDERGTSDQWEWLHMSLQRQISLDTSIWDLTPQEPLPSPPISTKSHIFPSTQNSMEDSSQHSEGTSHHSVTEQGQTQVKRGDSNYQKNICAYITKKAVQCFIQATYRKKVEKLCLKYGCSYNKAIDYYRQNYKKVFGITLLTLLISPQDEGEVEMKHIFRVFLKWFLREKYMLYVMKNGKMTEKDKYIEFKNKYLLYVNETEEKQRTC